MRAGAERAEVTVEQVVRELKLIGFSDIRKVVSWRNELVTRTEKGEDGAPVLMPRRPGSGKKEGLAQLEAALKNAKPIQFKENIALVLKYFDQLAPLMREQDSELRPAD
jgi:uncharacterized protein with ParB-like and HNH nuclease domain